MGKHSIKRIKKKVKNSMKTNKQKMINKMFRFRKRLAIYIMKLTLLSIHQSRKSILLTMHNTLTVHIVTQSSPLLPTAPLHHFSDSLWIWYESKGPLWDKLFLRKNLDYQFYLCEKYTSGRVFFFSLFLSFFLCFLCSYVLSFFYTHKKSLVSSTLQILH